MNEPAAGIAPRIAGAGPARAADDFSLVLGGPLYQILHRAWLAGDAMELLRRRVLVISLFAWAPLLLLSAATGRLLGGEGFVPFLMDVEVHVKFLVVVPLMIMAELVVHQRMLAVARTFRERRLVPDRFANRLDAAVASATRLRNSVVAELLLVAFVYVVGVTLVWRPHLALRTATWYSLPAADGPSFTAAGMWYGYVSLPILQFLLCRWYFRIFIWARLLFQVSRIPLDLAPMHPDRVGGLGFLSNTVYAFVPLLAAHGALLAGTLASQIFHAGARLTAFRLEILLLVVFVVSLVVGPLLVFAPQLSRLKRAGLRDYGTLAQRYARGFDEKWVRGGAPDDEALLGTGDIQSLADLGNAFEIVKGIRLVPVSKEAMVQLAMVTLVPVVPLVLTLMPLEELIRKLLGILF